MEILGLAVVIVLILIATVFVVKFSLKAPTDYRKGFVSSETASNILNAFLKTAAPECSQLTMTELLQDCAQGEAICCQNCNTFTEVKSCSYVNSTAITILNKTLDAWSMSYEFLAYNDDRSFIKLGKACIGQRESKLYPIPTSTTALYVKLDICI